MIDGCTYRRSEAFLSFNAKDVLLRYGLSKQRGERVIVRRVMFVMEMPLQKPCFVQTEVTKSKYMKRFKKNNACILYVEM